MSVVLRLEEFTAGSGPLDSTYTQQRTTPTVNYNGSGSAVASTTNQNVLAFDNFNDYPADQYSKLTVGVLEVGLAYLRATTRASGVGDSNINCYSVLSSGDHVELTEWAAGTETTILDIVATPVGGDDTLELQSIGTTHTVVLNSGVIGTPQVDATHLTGSAGFGLYDESGSLVAAISAWEGGTLEVGPNIRSRRLATQQRMVA